MDDSNLLGVGNDIQPHDDNNNNIDDKIKVWEKIMVSFILIADITLGVFFGELRFSEYLNEHKEKRIYRWMFFVFCNYVWIYSILSILLILYLCKTLIRTIVYKYSSNIFIFLLHTFAIGRFILVLVITSLLIEDEIPDLNKAKIIIFIWLGFNWVSFSILIKYLTIDLIKKVVNVCKKKKSNNDEKNRKSAKKTKESIDENLESIILYT